MVLDSKIQQVKYHFGINDIEDWTDVEPGWITNMDGIGPATLEHIRIYLAARGVTLKNDATPQYWNERLAEMRIGQTMGEFDISITAPFTILIDSMEQQPFGFEGMHTDASDGNRPLVVPTEWKALGTGMGDYSIKGLEGECHIERKSLNDAHGTILGWGPRRENFERTLENLQEMPCSGVVVECSFGALLANAPAWGKKSREQNKKILHRQVMAWQQDYRVPWVFCDHRRLAEITAYRIMERFWKKRNGQKKQRRTQELETVLASL